MTTFGDLLSARDRQLLEESLWQQNKRDLTTAARDSATESTGTSRVAWICVAMAVDSSESPAEAREAIDEMTKPGQLRDLARTCLAELTDTTGAAR